jgi:hypothetical protein
MIKVRKYFPAEYCSSSLRMPGTSAHLFEGAIAMIRTDSSDSEGNYLLRDGLVATSLICALFVVYGMDSIDSDSSSSVPQISEIQETVVNQVTPPEPVNRLRLGVTPADFDDMGSLLKTLGEGYQYEDFQIEELLDSEKLKEIDILFLTCGGFPDSWLGKQLNEATRGRDVYQFRPEIVERATENLRTFVKQGGTLYASDWRFVLIANAFENFVDVDKVIEGDKQTVEAEVVDPGLREVLGDMIRLNFDQAGWNPAAFKGEEMVTYLRGHYRSPDNAESEAALLVKFPFGEGNVIFTSFHNEKQNSETEIELLRYLVFTTVTARTESEIQQTMVAGGFSPASRDLLSASNETPSVTRSWQCTTSGPVQFVLGFQNQGAVLRLTVVGLDGKTYEKESTSTFQIDVPDAQRGEWKYTVTAVTVPYANFPFTLTIGEKTAD